MAKWLAVMLAFAAAACASTGGSPDAPFARAGASAGGAGIDTGGLAVYLELMQQLVQGDALAQAEAFRSAEAAADYAPTTTNRLKYALALAVPGHAGSNAQLAAQRLSALLDAGDALLPEERVLAAIHLGDVEQRLALDAAAEQLRAESAAAIEQQNTESARRLEAALEENRRLQAELEDATEKLDALTTIEQSIRERENGAN